MASGRAEREPLTRQRVFSAALHLIDTEGVDALSMRRLGAELGVQAMSLYHHVPNKAALIDGVVDQVMGELTGMRLTDASTWDEVLTEIAVRYRDAMHSHPNAFGLVSTRSIVTPTGFSLMNEALERLTACGYSALNANVAINTVGAFVVGALSFELSVNPYGVAHPNVDDQFALARTLAEEGMQGLQQLLSELEVEPERFEHWFDQGLAAVVQGLGGLRTSRPTPPGDQVNSRSLG